jgi:AcrR family transcriptional regulator
VPRPRRSDSRRNRAAILRAATDAIVHSRDILSLRRIAGLAGVGQATVYRHFPDRRSLALAVMREQLAALAALVAGCEDDPAAFRPVLREVLLAQVSMRPLVAVLMQQPETEQQRYVEQLVGVLAGPFRRSQAAGLLRPDLEPGDLAVVLAMFEAGIQACAGGARTGRVVDLVLDGLFVAEADHLRHR